jgi:hypothetical protein
MIKYLDFKMIKKRERDYKKMMSLNILQRYTLSF